MDNKVITNLTPDTPQWTKAMEACNRSDKMIPLLNRKLAQDELKKLLAKPIKDDK